MSAQPGDIKKQAPIKVEINGVAYEASRGDMIIEVTDAAGIQIPRFCYHKKLSIAANCRMCLVEVDKVPKPLPACATPVADGMKIYTHSPKALEAQKGTMEFLLINHPLDCPICDEGGECELQETSLGFGADFSKYDLPKRVVMDEDIGPLIETEMTRCIHCTRCVRFGDEVAGIRELGATGRGEHMRIGTYIGKTVSSEMSGNVIELCPVGALTSKPFRFKARAWELERRPAVSPHDCIGSNLSVRTRGSTVMRVDPRENEEVNECWIPDRDRYSYEALNSPERLSQPMIRRDDGAWEQVDWNTALEAAVSRLRATLGTEPAQLGTLVSPSATLEEMHLLQRLTRELGSPNIDHRLRQVDFRDQERAPPFPWLGQTLESLASADAVLLVGSYTRKDQPILGHRLRQAALRGTRVMFINPVAWEFNFPVAENIAAGPAGMEHSLAAIAKAVFEKSGGAPPAGYDKLLATVTVDDAARRVAAHLTDAKQPALLLGDIAGMHPAYSTLRALATVIARTTGARIGNLSPGANGAGAWLTGVVPHRAPGGEDAQAQGLHASAMLEERLKAFLLFNVEPEYDVANPARAVEALQEAGCVIALSPFRSETMQAYADIILPISPFTETAGTYINAEGRWQTFNGSVKPKGEARPGWKVLRVLGNLLDLRGFEYMSVEDIREELRHEIDGVSPSSEAEWRCPQGLSAGEDADGTMRVGHVPLYAADNIVRRADALQQTLDARRAPRVTIGRALATRLGLRDGQRARVTQGDGSTELPVVVDDAVPAGCALIPAGLRETRALGPMFGPVTLAPATGSSDD